MATEVQNISGPIPEFLDKVSNNWGLTFVYPKIWAISFSPVTSKNSSSNLGAAIKQVLTKYNDINNFRSVFYSKNPYSQILSSPNEVNVSVGDAAHFLLANKISIPGENVQFSSGTIPAADVAGGVLWGRVLGSRQSGNANTNKIKITFFDTNKELIDLLIKPWLAAISYQGLIEDASCPQLKCDITAYFFAKSSAKATVNRNDEIQITSNIPQFFNSKQNSVWTTSNASVKVSQLSEDKPYLRKTITFKNCVPVNIPEKSYNFGNDIALDEIMTAVDFSYDYYIIDDKSANAVTANRRLAPVYLS